jgi:hypothetical protein
MQSEILIIICFTEGRLQQNITICEQKWTPRRFEGPNVGTYTAEVQDSRVTARRSATGPA